MRNLSFKAKLAVLVSFLMLVICLIGGGAFYASFLNGKILNKISTIDLPALRALSEIDMHHEAFQGLVYRCFQTVKINSDSEAQKLHRDFQESHQKTNELFQKLKNLNLTSEQIGIVNKAEEKMGAYIQSAQKIIELSLELKEKEAWSIFPQFDFAFHDLETQLEQAAQVIEKRAEETRREGEMLSDQTHRFTLVALVSSLFVGILFSVWMIRDLMQTVEQVLSQLQDSTQAIGDVSEEGAETAQALAESATEQASSLQETMASLEQISAMVSQNAESSRVVRKSVEENAQSVSKGDQSVQAMVSAIEEIKSVVDQILNQMDNSNREFTQIVKIISEIDSKTKVINDIVFQTKLLSFNASVEAARAGEHGKGFAVVASEVGNLANMSGQASKEITSMLTASISKVNEIVKLTSQKVEHLMEVGRDKIAMGQITAKKCQDAFAEVTSNAQGIVTGIQEISRASDEQAQGVNEINKAIAQLELVTQKNSQMSLMSQEQSLQLKSETQGLRGCFEGLYVFAHGPYRVTQSRLSRDVSPRALVS